ncbi:hypothetical protein HOD08_01025 [bacterium]|nr:hypothetical protein [bacterium]
MIVDIFKKLAPVVIICGLVTQALDAFDPDSRTSFLHQPVSILSEKEKAICVVGQVPSLSQHDDRVCGNTVHLCPIMSSFNATCMSGLLLTDLNRALNIVKWRKFFHCFDDVAKEQIEIDQLSGGAYDFCMDSTDLRAILAKIDSSVIAIDDQEAPFIASGIIDGEQLASELSEKMVAGLKNFFERGATLPISFCRDGHYLAASIKRLSGKYCIWIAESSYQAGLPGMSKAELEDNGMFIMGAIIPALLKVPNVTEDLKAEEISRLEPFILDLKEIMADEDSAVSDLGSVSDKSSGYVSGESDSGPCATSSEDEQPVPVDSKRSCGKDDRCHKSYSITGLFGSLFKRAMGL